MFKIKMSQGTWTKHEDLIRKCKEENSPGCLLSLHLDPAAAILKESVHQTGPISGESGTEENLTCASDDSPVFLPQQVVPVVQKEHHSMISP